VPRVLVAHAAEEATMQAHAALLADLAGEASMGSEHMPQLLLPPPLHILLLTLSCRPPHVRAGSY
jgi:hypothetical protein